MSPYQDAKLKARVKAWIRKEICADTENYQDSAGEFISTTLGESCAQHFDLYDCDDDEATIPEWVFDLALETVWWYDDDEETEE